MRAIGWAKGEPLYAAEPAPEPRQRTNDHRLEISTLRSTLADAQRAAERACIRPGETLAELIARLYSETLDRDDD